ncbi:MAG: L-aspartate oxidase [Nitrospirae bacterium GWC2_57_13]|nr:MAG: L-aspartate oxidase [Nitrospirae bacterium GWC1_57_7]OGW26496.1 MAG: L-aspartate oxidase [Nitrospirae bacterium GWC2_57_13]HAR46391.1 L-aspartate oxidase [Nitrospiraceae bacterium]HAS53266.1 L-aspartate oxidase [Nitrospiraceae bacterium]
MDRRTEHITTDYLVIGGGVAGLRAAIELGRSGEVLVVTKAEPTESSSEYAQGGVAVALSDEDEISIHYEDTLKAGDGLCIRRAVKTLVEEGPMRIRELMVWGAEFDREGAKLAFTQEAAHSKRRILHAQGDSTGREIMRVLIDKVRSTGKAVKLDFAFTVDLLLSRGRCCGAVVLQEKLGKTLIISAKAVVLATGGAGQLFERTTNPLVATGDGMAMAFRAGAALLDMEFVQFHPTALYRPGAPQFLLSEAMRGEGGKLLNARGIRFMDAYHQARELAPRDVVTRAIHTEMAKTGDDHVFLDMTHLSTDYVKTRFPRIYATCQEYGIDITATPIPASPAAHYIMGGVRTDAWGRTTVPGLFAAGETACTGVHGANRLASNSLLEGLVFGERAGLAAARYAAGPQGKKRPVPAPSLRHARSSANKPLSTGARERMRVELKRLMWEQVSVVRDRKTLAAALRRLQAWAKELKNAPFESKALELRNMVTTALLITRSALLRENSVGAHYRSDFPGKGKTWRKRIVLEK